MSVETQFTIKSGDVIKIATQLPDRGAWHPQPRETFGLITEISLYRPFPADPESCYVRFILPENDPSRTGLLVLPKERFIASSNEAVLDKQVKDIHEATIVYERLDLAPSGILWWYHGPSPDNAPGTLPAR